MLPAFKTFNVGVLNRLKENKSMQVNASQPYSLQEKESPPVAPWSPIVIVATFLAQSAYLRNPNH